MEPQSQTPGVCGSPSALLAVCRAGRGQHSSWGAGDRQTASRQHSWGGLTVLTWLRCKTSWRHFSKNTEALPKEGGPAGLSVSQEPAVSGVEFGGLWWRLGEHGSSPRHQKSHYRLGGPGTLGRVRMLRRRWAGSHHQQVRGRGASVPLNKGSHAGGWAAVSLPTPGWRGVVPSHLYLRLAEGQPTSAAWDPRRATDQDKADE